MLETAPSQAPPNPRGCALWQLGFRPFYLLAALQAVASIALWALQMLGWLHPYLAAPVWHAHEMVFGFAMAVIVGFLFTAGRNWSHQPTPTGPLLAALALLWVAGRILVLAPWPAAAALVNAAFPLAAAIALAVPFLRSRNRRNYFFVGMLVLAAAASLGVHLALMGRITVPAWLGLQAGLDVVLFILAVMGGRVIPMFTNNGIPGAGARKRPWIERAALGSILALLAASALQAPALVLALLAAAAAAAHLARWLLWRPWRTLGTPLVWVLHLAYAWIPVHLALRAMAAAGRLAPTFAIHALTVGALGGLVIGMMTRTSRGHTARPLKADAWDTASYLLVAAAAALRVLLPMALPEAYRLALGLSALAWSAGFAIFLVRYGPVLTRPRLDGQPG